MPEHQESLARILRTRAVGIVRASIGCDLVAIAKALLAGGVDVVEITATTPGVEDGIRGISARLGDILIGAGTVLGRESAQRMLDAGAKFLVSPSLDREVVRCASERDAVAIPGALTATEVIAAWEAGGDIIKVFPAAALGASYIRALKGPLPEIPLAPTGGVTADNAGEYLKAGASIVCVGGWLTPETALRQEDYATVTKRAERLVLAVKRARERSG